MWKLQYKVFSKLMLLFLTCVIGVLMTSDSCMMGTESSFLSTIGVNKNLLKGTP